MNKGKHKDVTNSPFIKILRFPTQISILKSQFSGLSFKFEAGRDAEVALDIKKGAGGYIVVRSVLFLMVMAAYAPAGGM